MFKNKLTISIPSFSLPKYIGSKKESNQETRHYFILTTDKYYKTYKGTLTNELPVYISSDTNKNTLYVVPFFGVIQLKHEDIKKEELLTIESNYLHMHKLYMDSNWIIDDIDIMRLYNGICFKLSFDTIRDELKKKVGNDLFFQTILKYIDFLNGYEKNSTYTIYNDLRFLNKTIQNNLYLTLL